MKWGGLTAVAAAYAASLALAAGPSLPTQKSTERGVTVAVTPKNVAPEAAQWEFAVVLDTHSQDLNDDLAGSSVLLDAGGNRVRPLSWKGAPAGGHHRTGTLFFKPPAPRPQSIELQIHRPGEPKARVFRWQP